MRARTTRMLAAALLLAGAAQAATLPGAWLAKVDPDLVEAAQAQGTAEFLVALNSRADLSLAAGARTRETKAALVMQLLKAHAASTQSGVLRELAARGREARSFWVANVVASSGSLADIRALAARADVAHVYLVKPELVDLPGGVEGADGASVVNAGPEPGLSRVGAPAVWALGFRGEGVVVGDHDIGVDWDHPALKKKYRGWNEATQTVSHDYNWRNAFVVDHYCPDPAEPCDPNSHGTHTTGTMVGDDGAGNQIGMAPGARWIGCRSLYDNVAGLGTVPTYLDCMQWMIAPFPIGDHLGLQADPAKSPDIVSNSWGCVEACAPPVLQDVNDATKAAGILQVASAGNEGAGGCSTIAFPLAVYDSTFTVGNSTFADTMSGSSSRGPVLTDGSMRIKPNVVAPGTSVRSSTPNGGYGAKSGTSMASPHVAGLAALVMSAEPRLKGRVDEVRTLIEQTAFRGVNSTQACGGVPATTIPNNVFGYGRVDALAAVQARPQLVTTVGVPGTAEIDDTFAAVVTVTSPAGGKLPVTESLAAVSVPAGLQILSASETPASTATDGSGTTLQFARAAALAPGAAWTITLQLKAVGAGVHAIATAAEADLVSPKAGGGANVEVRGVEHDLTPDAFTFVERTGVATGVYITSETRTITGIDAPAAVGIANGQYSIDGGAYTTAAGTIASGQTLRVRHVSASGSGQTTTSTVTVGTYSSEFRSTTSTSDATPDAFGFETQTGVAPSMEIESNVITPAGYNTPVSVVAGPGASYRINGGAWTTATTTINPGDTLQTKHTSAGTSLAYKKTYLKVGGVTGYFTSRTR